MTEDHPVEWDLDNNLPMYTRDYVKFVEGLRGAGGNRFIEADATRGQLMSCINDQLGDLYEWAEPDQEVDLGRITILAQRIPSGRISVTVMGDLKEKNAKD